MWIFKKSKKKMESVMVYKKITELSKQYMIYNAVTNERKWEDKKMDCDNQELEATKKMREKKCKYCDLVSGDEKDIGELKNDELVIERHNNTYLLNGFADEVEINYCPMCGRKLN